MISALLTSLFLSLPIQATPLQEAARLSQAADYEGSDKVLAMVAKKDQGPTYYFYRLVNAFSTNRKVEAQKWAYMLEYGFEDVPQRYRDLALIMRLDMSVWKNNADDLEDISREMRKSRDRLQNGLGGPATQKIQKDVEARLAKMIKKLEDDQAAAKAAAQAAKEDKEKDGQKKQPSEINPASDTHNNQERGTGQVDKKRVEELAKVWGTLPEKERAKAIVELTRGMPAKDRAVIVGYFKELQRQNQRKSK